MAEDYNVIQAYLRDLRKNQPSEEEVEVLFQHLFSLEESFAERLQSSLHGRKIYLDFLNKIFKVRGGMKIARSYFRVRQDRLGEIYNAIKINDPKCLYGVQINYRFCVFAMESMGEMKDETLSSLFEGIKKAREEIIKQYLYLPINRAKRHNQSVRGMSSAFEDLVQIANEALIIAVDKYVLDDQASSFYSTAVGRMVKLLIERGAVDSAATIGEHSQKKLYQIRRVLQKDPTMQHKDIADALKIAEEEISSLVAATSYRSLDEPVGGDDSDTRRIDIFSTPEKEKDEVEEAEAIEVMYNSFSVLSILERKVLRLKGIKMGEMNASA